MDWFEKPVALDAAAATKIAADMMLVARADGDVHPNEVELIESFRDDIPDLVGLGELGDVNDVRSAWLRSLIMVALADGVISDPEATLIHRLATDQGFTAEAVEAEMVTVKRKFLDVFGGVTIFRGAVQGVAQSLGLDDSQE